MESRNLYRSKTNAQLTGVCGGLAEYLRMDATVVRLVWVIVVIFSGFVPGILLYIIAVMVMPFPPEPPTVDAKVV